MNTMQTVLFENSLSLPRNSKRTKLFRSVMTSIIMLTSNQNLFNFVVSQNSKTMSV